MPTPALKAPGTERCGSWSSVASSGTTARSMCPTPTACRNEYEISPYGDYLINRLAAPD